MTLTRTPLAERFEQKVFRSPCSGCWLWLGQLAGGYGIIHDGGRVSKVRKAHRISYETHRGQIPQGMCVLHTCDIRECVNPEHLFLGTRLDNNRDRHIKGRDGSHVGPANGRAKLSWELAAKIRTDTRKIAIIAEEFGVCRSTVNRIRSGQYWPAHRQGERP